MRTTPSPGRQRLDQLIERARAVARRDPGGAAAVLRGWTADTNRSRHGQQ